MGAWSDGAQQALLLHLSDSNRIAAAVTELWRVSKGHRELRCVAQYLASGIDLRLMKGDGFRRTQLCRDAPEADALSRGTRRGV
jgi:hypothetical protein